jgi:CheY-like chemotaxis protein
VKSFSAGQDCGVGKRILIIEDEEDIREILKEFFEGEGFDVLTAVHGMDAMRVLEEKGNPNLILIDLMMPVMSGEEFIEKKKTIPHLCDIPTVIMSADHRTQAKAAALGIKWAINKPLELSALVSIVDEVFNGA